MSSFVRPDMNSSVSFRIAFFGYFPFCSQRLLLWLFQNHKAFSCWSKTNSTTVTGTGMPFWGILVVNTNFEDKNSVEIDKNFGTDRNYCLFRIIPRSDGTSICRQTIKVTRFCFTCSNFRQLSTNAEWTHGKYVTYLIVEGMCMLFFQPNQDDCKRL